MDNCEYKFNGGSEKILQNIKYLIIDEISMVRPDLLDNVADILRHARVKSLDGLYLRQPIPKTVKTSDQVVINFYKRTLGNGGIVKPVPMEELEKSMISLSTGSEIDFAEFNL